MNFTECPVTPGCQINGGNSPSVDRDARRPAKSGTQPDGGAEVRDRQEGQGPGSL